jgi:hypothetical protein
MTHAEQRERIQELMDYRRNMSRQEQEEFDMFIKRNKDDEDLDAMSRKRLVDLYEKHIPPRKRNY